MWLASLFQRIAKNEQPYVKSIYNIDCEKHYSSTGRTYNFEQVENMTTNVIDSYKDRDNPSPTWNFDGYDWNKSSDGKWTPTIHSMNVQQEIDPYEYICSVYSDLEINKINSPLQPEVERSQQVSEKLYLHVKKQSDSGANTSATNNLQLLHDITYINPINVNSATENAVPMKMVAVGNLHLRTVSKDVVKVACYYSPDVSGTILSPDAIARQYKSRFQGFRKVCDIHNNTGYLIFDPIHNSQDTWVFNLKADNNLWYHQEEPISRGTTCNPTPSINKLSTAANYELWHQRLCHPGPNIMQTIHKHSKGVPQLRGNSFWKCASCMMGKCDKSYHVKHPAKKLQSLLTDTTSKEEEDDIYMPSALPGQHFHFDFGFMRTKHYQQEDQDGRTQTSIDGKNAYLLVIDRKTRYMWVYVNNA